MRLKCSWTVLAAVLVLSGVSALYEDQIKKFDWRSIHVGALRQSHLELNTFQPRLLISTNENVLAALCPKTGELLWRQVLETGSRGDIKLLQVADASSTAAARSNSNQGFDLLTIQGHALIRGWNALTGVIEWEWSLTPLQPERDEAAVWFYKNALIYHVVPVWKSHLEVTPYIASTGQATSLTSKISASWISAENCVLAGTYFSCLRSKELFSLDLTATEPQILRKSLTNAGETIKAVPGANGVVIVDEAVVNVRVDQNDCANLRSKNFILGSYNQKQVLLSADVLNNALKINVHYADNCEEVPQLSQNVPYPTHFGTPKLNSFDCKAKRNSAADNNGKACLFLLSTADESILAVQQGKLRWTRDEALANVVATEFVDLPLADAEGTLENEMKSKSEDGTGFERDIASAFVRRISTQVLQMKSIFLHIIGLGVPPSDTQKAGLVRDSFGLHKMLVVLTRSGKIFGIDNVSGKHHWQEYLESAQNFENNENMRLIVQRTSKHFPLQPLCTIVAKNKLTGNGILYRFNPITGKASEGGLLELQFKIKQIALLAETETDFVKGILALDAENGVHIYPESAKETANGMYLYSADKKTATLDGLYVKLTAGKLRTTAIWNVRLAGFTGEQEIIAVAAKNPIEHVHSQGRVLGDRSVLYKYINPNLVTVITQANDNIHKYVLNTYLVDVVSGSVVFSMTHRKARGPLHIVHSENWMVYSYYNDKVRRTEITAIELYEGKIQANNTIWSSLNAPPMPLVERQSYIIPTSVETMRETITERGITNKHVLIGTTGGSVIEMPWVLLDPRRPITTSTQGREEGAIPYIPELPMPTDNIINYNQTIARLRNIYTSPSGLESTCLVVATGLDIFVTRVAPSKTFDLLKEDFDYMLISVVLVALTTGSLIVKHLASRKLLKQAWK